MNTIISEPTWGYHMNDSIYTLSCPPYPKWAKSFDQQSWNKLGVVVWDTQIQRITHLFGSQAMRILEDSRESKVWKKKGLVVGKIVYRIIMPADKKSKSKVPDQPTEPPPKKMAGVCLIQFSYPQVSPSNSYLFWNKMKQS